jgi:Bacterial Ig-like domain (group 2)/Putative Ig domain/Galactose oxidase, central domain/Kelch motif
MKSRYVKSLAWSAFSILLLTLSACGGGGGGGIGSPPPTATAPSDLSYSTAPAFIVGTAIAALTPTVVGDVTSYSVSPTLPAGLSLNTASGVISGTPTSVAAKANYAVEASNSGGSTTAVVSITVMAAAPAAPSDLKYLNPPAFVVGLKITPLTPTVTGTVTSYSVKPALPAGLNLDTSTGVISGTPTSAATATTYTVTASNEAGSTSATVSIAVSASVPAGYTAKSGVAQKGPLIQGSTVTAQELDANLSPTGQQFSYQILTNLGNFTPTSTFTSPFIGLNANGFYFDEVQGATSSAAITLNGYSDLAVDSVLNVNILTTLEYQRIQTLMAKSGLTFTAARTQAEGEVLAALNIPPASYGSFGTLDLSGNSDGDHILAAISSIFVYGNTAASLSVLMASFQSDIGKNGVITVSSTKTALAAASKSVNATTVATNLTQYYSSDGITFSAADITDWIDQDGDGVVGKFKFQVADATPSSTFAFPAFVLTQVTGTAVSATGGQLLVNGKVVSGSTTVAAGDTVTVSPGAGSFPNGILNVYLLSGGTRTARVSFVSGLVSIAVTPAAPSIASGLTQQFTATGTFSDTSTADLTAKVAWASDTPAVATINASSGLATAVAVGSSAITATLGSVSGSAALDVTAAVLESIISINPTACGAGLSTQLVATGTYSDGTTTNVTSLANWMSSTPTVATVNPTTGLATCVSTGSTTITATVGSVTKSSSLTTFANVWSLTASMSTARADTTATLLQSGKVLVVGGDPLSSGEIYDPVLSTWSGIAAGPTPIGGQTATLLPNGMVLIAGGRGDTLGYAQSSERLYDPVANTWFDAASMSTARTMATATLLPNGKVLVAGGLGITSGGSVSNGLASAEVYDPVANTWSVVASMASARASHTATLLPNGLVLVAGGETGVGGNTIASAELYDPVANTWSSAGSLANSRVNHTATLLRNGRVIITGGSASSTTCGCTATSEIYDPVANAWSVGPSMSVPRENHIAVLLTDGTVLVAGGDYSYATDSNGWIWASAEIYNPVAGTWSITGSMSTPRASAAATPLSNGAVLVAGGESDYLCDEASLACPGGYSYLPSTIASAELYWP